VEELCRSLRRATAEAVAGLVEGRVVILAGNAAGSAAMASFCADAGACAVHSLALPTDGTGLAHRLAALEDALARPPVAVVDQLDAIDPNRRAVVYAGSFTAARWLAGRRVLGARSRPQFDAERKDVQDRLMGRGATRAPLTDGGLADIESRIANLASRGPVVVQGVPARLLAMGTSHTYAVPGSASRAAIGRLLASMVEEDCVAVRLVPMDRGIPCTYYGFVASRFAVDFGPFEALVYWDPASWRVRAPGIVRPLLLDARTEAACRSAVQAAMRRLHRQVGYSGAFGTDGVVIDTRYVIHEINPRLCAGFTLLDQMHQPAVPLTAIDLALRERATAAHPVIHAALDEVAAILRTMQRPLLRLWDDEHRSVEARMTAAAGGVSDPGAWVRLVRSAVAAEENLVPLMDLA
jgi:hypothetical protein